jgi:CO/xanthine dehydrogenase Mo-binding subunit
MSASSPSLQAHPLASQWLNFLADGNVCIFSGKVELGQGISTALIQTACNELGVDSARVKLTAGDTHLTPDEGYTAGSQSVEVGVVALKLACQEVRARYVDFFCKKYQCLSKDLEIVNGQIQLQDKSTSLTFYQISQLYPLSSITLNKLEHDHSVLPSASNEDVIRSDFTEKFTGAGYIHDLILPDLWHAKIVRGPHPFCKPVSTNLSALESLDGVTKVFIKHHFIALIGREEQLLSQALMRAKEMIVWSEPKVSTPKDIPTLLLNEKCTTSVALDKTDGTKESLTNQGTQKLNARYSRPYIAHASIGLACALAQSAGQGQSLCVWSHSQGVFKLREQLAQSLNLTSKEVRVIHAHGAGCYGHNGADDVAFDAVLIAHSLGINVRVVWSREDELTHSPMGAASLVELAAEFLQNGKLLSWNSQVWSNTHLNRPGWGEGIQLLGAWSAYEDLKPPLAKDVPLPSGGGLRNAVPAYETRQLKITHHLIENAPMRVSALRSLGAHANVFAIESFMDEIALVLNIDPVELRLINLSQERAKAVIQRVAQMSGWQSRGPAASSIGMGMAYAQYKNHAGHCAIAIQVEVSHKILVRKVWACVDAGLIVHKNGLLNQIEGGILQSLSWTLKERVQWNAHAIISSNWETYPILMFDEIPEIEIDLIENKDNTSLGAGEVAAGPTAAALANALSHALGVRLRDLPFTFENITKSIQEG